MRRPILKYLAVVDDYLLFFFLRADATNVEVAGDGRRIELAEVDFRVDAAWVLATDAAFTESLLFSCPERRRWALGGAVASPTSDRCDDSAADLLFFRAGWALARWKLEALSAVELLSSSESEVHELASDSFAVSSGRTDCRYAISLDTDRAPCSSRLVIRSWSSRMSSWILLVRSSIRRSCSSATSSSARVACLPLVANWVREWSGGCELGLKPPEPSPSLDVRPPDVSRRKRTLCWFGVPASSGLKRGLLLISFNSKSTDGVLRTTLIGFDDEVGRLIGSSGGGCCRSGSCCVRAESFSSGCTASSATS